MVVACMVNIWLYTLALKTLPSGAASWRRMSTASMPPTMKKNIAMTPYIMPSFLWSTVKSHDFHPVVATGRLKPPCARDGVAGGAISTPPAVAGRSIIAMSACSDHFSVER